MIGTKPNEIGTILLFRRKLRYVKLNMLKIAPKTKSGRPTHLMNDLMKGAFSLLKQRLPVKPHTKTTGAGILFSLSNQSFRRSKH